MVRPCEPHSRQESTTCRASTPWILLWSDVLKAAPGVGNELVLWCLGAGRWSAGGCLRTGEQGGLRSASFSADAAAMWHYILCKADGPGRALSRPCSNETGKVRENLKHSHSTSGSPATLPSYLQ